MSPEQVRGHNVDARSDIFAFGAVLYEMLSGRRAFKGDSAIDSLNAVLTRDPPDLTDPERGIAPSIERVVRRCLEKRPGERFQSARDLGFALDEAWTGSRPSGERARIATERRPSWMRASIWAASVLVAGVAAWAFWPRASSPAAAGPSSLRISEVISERIGAGGGISRVAWSPRDENLIAYSLNSEGKTTIWVKQLQGGDPREITDGTWNDRDPIWSPDGQRLAFISDRGGTPGVWVIPSLGGTPELKTPLNRSNWSLTGWSADARTIYFESSSDLYAIELATGHITPITTPDPKRTAARDFRISADGNQIAYADAIDGKFRILVMPRQGGRAVPITAGEGDDVYPAWFPDSRTLAFTSSRAGQYQVYLTALDRRAPRQLTYGNDIAYQFLVVAPSGDRILSVSQNNHANVFASDSQTGAESAQTADFGRLQLFPDISRDATRLAFQSASSNVMTGGSIAISPIGAPGKSEQIATDAFDVKWSPAEDALAFLRKSGDSFELWRVSASGRNEQRLTSGILIGGTTGVPLHRLAVHYNWSPDGTRIAYLSAKSGAPNVWTISATGADDKRVSGNMDPAVKINSPFWSADGQQIAYVQEQTGPAKEKLRSIWTTKAAGSEGAAEVCRKPTPLRLLGWSATGGELYVAEGESERTSPQGVNLLRISASGRSSAPTRLADVYLYSVKLGARGQTIAFVSRQDQKSNISVIPAAGGAARKVTATSDPTIYYSGLTWSPDGKTLFYSKQTSWSIVSLIEGFRH
jgi:Tol biopolymer transport system component